MSTELKSQLRSGATWKRGLFILLFALLYGVAEVVLWAVVLFQFGSHLITGRSNDTLLDFSRGLNAYFYQILQYISFRTEYKPYPFNDWPGEGLSAVEGQTLTPPPEAEATADTASPEDKGETESGV
jgi:hypothetical protein